MLANKQGESDMPLVSIIVSNHNGWRMNILEHCLRSILDLDYPRFEVIVVDNASNDGSVGFVKRIFSNGQVRIVENHENNYARGLNLGFEEAKGDLVAYLNNDTEVDKFYLKEIVRAMVENPNVALAQGRLMSFYDHTTIDSVGETMDLFGNPFTIGGGQRGVERYNKAAEILSASGSACIVRKSVVEAVGRYDEAYHIFYEDMDLALRIRSRGYVVIYVPKAIVYHMRGKTDLSQELREENKFHFNKNRIATMVKNYDLFSMLQALPVVSLIYALALLLEVRKDNRLVTGRLKSILWNLSNLRYLLSMRKSILSCAIADFRRQRRLLFRRRISQLVLSLGTGLVG